MRLISRRSPRVFQTFLIISRFCLIESQRLAVSALLGGNIWGERLSVSVPSGSNGSAKKLVGNGVKRLIFSDF